jgi:hypothetical protein
MQHSKEHIFPTIIRRFRFDNDEIKPLLDEVLEKKQKIKDVSYYYNGTISDNYFTDYKKPVKFREYEILIDKIITEYKKDNFLFNLNYYWTAIYGKGSRHDPHHHRSISENYSSILYLNNYGETTFLSPNHTGEYDYYKEKAEVGKLVIFPADLWHYVEYQGLGERIIISSNFSIQGY